MMLRPVYPSQIVPSVDKVHVPNVMMDIGWTMVLVDRLVGLENILFQIKPVRDAKTIVQFALTGKLVRSVK